MISGLRAPQRLETTHRLTSIRLSPSAWPTCVHGLLGHHRLRTPLRRWRFGRCVSDMPVDGGSADAELGGDLGHRVGVYRPHRPRDTPRGSQRPGEKPSLGFGPRCAPHGLAPQPAHLWCAWIPRRARTPRSPRGSGRKSAPPPSRRRCPDRARPGPPRGPRQVGQLDQMLQ